MVYGDFKDFRRRTPSDRRLSDKVFNLVKKPKYDAYQQRLASMVYKFFNKKSLGGAVTRATQLHELHEIFFLLKIKFCQINS